jgi:nucleolar GTP-binding protein
MVKYNFKSIQVIPTGPEFVNIVLNKTQRKTPTVVHPGYSINRIRQFYMKKVKFTQTLIHDKLTHILTDFPILDEIHPFYADLMNVLYDKDHYKLALGQLNTARRLVDNIGRDYLKLLKFSDSLYRCKQLKRAALGRMVKVLRKNGTSFSYLEEVRQHMARLPSIEPNTRTLLITGYPNVGKSSFMNKITRANVEVQPYAFTTKSLFVGHTDHRMLTWQVIDTPGILDGPLEERNTKEMQSITALAHLKAAILYFIDISEDCGYSIEQQVALYNSINPLFTGKPITVVLNKIDVRKPEDLNPQQKELIDSIIKDSKVNHVYMSNISEEGVMLVKQTACDALLSQRVETKLHNRKLDDVMNRIHLSQPVPRDDISRPPTVPETLEKGKSKKRFEEWKYQQKLYKELDPDYQSMDWKEDYTLENDEWKRDKIPEIMDGKNVFDFWTGSVDSKLSELEREEIARTRNLEEIIKQDEINYNKYKLTPEQQAKVKRIREKRKLIVQESRQKRTIDKPVIPMKYNTKGLSVSDFEEHLETLGMDPSAAAERMRSESTSKTRSQTRGRKLERQDPEERELSKTPLPGEGFRNIKQKQLAEKLARRSVRRMTKQGRLGESDRHIGNEMPKHLFSGKSGVGAADRR